MGVHPVLRPSSAGVTSNTPNKPPEDRFVCRREGHLPQVTITKANGVEGHVITKCQRCGKFIEVPIQPEATA